MRPAPRSTTCSAARLGPPRGMLSLALKVRLATDREPRARRCPAAALEVAAAIPRRVGERPGRDAGSSRPVQCPGHRPAGDHPGGRGDLLASAGAHHRAPQARSGVRATRSASACLRTDHTGYTGSGFVACLKTQDSGVRFNAPVSGDGLTPVRLRYANAMGATQTMTLAAERIGAAPDADPCRTGRPGRSRASAPDRPGRLARPSCSAPPTTATSTSTPSPSNQTWGSSRGSEFPQEGRPIGPALLPFPSASPPARLAVSRSSYAGSVPGRGSSPSRRRGAAQRGR